MPPRYTLGLAATSYLSVWQTIDTLEFLERARSFGAAGIQAVLNCDPAVLRDHTSKYEMYFEAMVPLPNGDDTVEFEYSLKNAQAAGAVALRGACLGTRRYESFSTLDAWREHVERSRRSLAATLPLLEKYKIPLGLENHKDWTAEEHLQLMRDFSSEYLRVCLDFGNNISLLDLPMEAIVWLAPFVVTTHVKDIAVAGYEEGILLSEVVLGRGLLDIPQAVGLIRKARPDCRMSLEMITRAPLKIPMLAESYWTTFPDTTGRELAQVLRYANNNASSLSVGNEDEDCNIQACFEAWRSMNL